MLLLGSENAMETLNWLFFHSSLNCCVMVVMVGYVMLRDGSDGRVRYVA